MTAQQQHPLPPRPYFGDDRDHVQALQNWAREYDWQGRRQGDYPVAYPVETWRSPSLWQRIAVKAKRHGG